MLITKVLVGSLKDVLKITPYIFLIFLVVDFLMGKVNLSIFKTKNKLDVVGGGIIGIVPQCAIPVAFSRLYMQGYVSLGMIIALFISSSDEAMVIIGAHPDKLSFVMKIILLKILLGILIGFLINMFMKDDKNNYGKSNPSMACNCSYSDNIFIHNLIHTLKIAFYLYITVFIFNFTLKTIGKDTLSLFLGKNTFLQPIYASLIGIIPSCLSSVVLAEGYIKGVITFGSLIAGLCANTGFGILIIFKELSLKVAVKIFAILIFASMIIGETIYLIGA